MTARRWTRCCGKWRARLRIATGKTKNVGYFVDEEAAATAFDKAEHEEYGRCVREGSACVLYAAYIL